MPEIQNFKNVLNITYFFCAFNWQKIPEHFTTKYYVDSISLGILESPAIDVSNGFNHY